MPTQPSQPVGKQRSAPDDESAHFVPGQQSAWVAQVARQHGGLVHVAVQAPASYVQPAAPQAEQLSGTHLPSREQTVPAQQPPSALQSAPQQGGGRHETLVH